MLPPSLAVAELFRAAGAAAEARGAVTYRRGRGQGALARSSFRSASGGQRTSQSRKRPSGRQSRTVTQRSSSSVMTAASWPQRPPLRWRREEVASGVRRGAPSSRSALDPSLATSRTAPAATAPSCFHDSAGTALAGRGTLAEDRIRGDAVAPPLTPVMRKESPGVAPRAASRGRGVATERSRPRTGAEATPFAGGCLHCAGRG